MDRLPPYIPADIAQPPIEPPLLFQSMLGRHQAAIQAAACAVAGRYFRAQGPSRPRCITRAAMRQNSKAKTPEQILLYKTSKGAASTTTPASARPGRAKSPCSTSKLARPGHGCHTI